MTAPAYVDSVSQTRTTYLPSATLLLPSPSSLHPPPQSPSTTQDQASVREGLATDTKCGTKWRNGDPQTHIDSSTHTSQPSSKAYSVVNFWHVVQDQRQLFLRETLWLDGKIFCVWRQPSRICHSCLNFQNSICTVPINLKYLLRSITHRDLIWTRNEINVFGAVFLINFSSEGLQYFRMQTEVIFSTI